MELPPECGTPAKDLPDRRKVQVNFCFGSPAQVMFAVTGCM